MELRKPTIDSDGMVAFHDQACPIFHQSEKAVYECNYGYFQTSWAAHDNGWIIVQAKTKFQRWLLKTFFGVCPKRGVNARLQKYRDTMQEKYPEPRNE